jgi:glutamine synthetase
LAIDEDKRIRTRFLPGTLIDAIKLCKTSDFITEIVGEELKEKYIDYKLMVADRSGKDL